MKSDVKIVEMGSPSKAEQEYHSGDVSYDDLAKEAGFPDIRKGDFPSIEPLWQPKEGN